MQSTVSLQELMSYSIWPVILSVVLVNACIIYLIITSQKKNNVQDTNVNKVKIKDIYATKTKYITELNKIEYNFNHNKIDLRTAYQRISGVIRMFIFEVTDIKTQNFTLHEIKKLNMPVIEKMIEEYYSPEFSERPEGDFKVSILEAKGVINQWR